jgi:acyl-CoA synthetase (AMP-forming)/AMP-acid ligase II
MNQSTPTLVNVALHLPRLAATQPHRLAVVYPHGRDAAGRFAYSHLTFAQLDRLSDELARGLLAVGLHPGTRTVLMVPPCLEFFALTFALFKLRAVPVLIDPGMGVRRLGPCLDEAQPGAFIAVPRAHLARRVLGWCRQTLRLTVTVGGSRWLAQHTLDDLLRLGGGSADLGTTATQADEQAAILFTSGSTGPAKGAVYTHGTFATQVEALRQLYAIEPGEVDLATFPLFALFGPALGMTAVVPRMNPTRPAQVYPPYILRAIDDWGVTNLFGSPALLNRVGRYAQPLGVTLPSLRRVVSAGAPVPAAVIERFTHLLPAGTQVYTPYGATEALPVANIGSDTILQQTRKLTELGRGVCLGLPVPGLRVAVVAVSDEPIPTWDDSLLLPPGQIGEFVVAGPWVTQSYYNRPEATRLAKIHDGQTIWHRMGDVGYQDEAGRLWFCGRKSQRVVTPQETLYTIPCEAVFNTHPAVYRTALVGVRRAGEQVPVLCVELEAGQRPSGELLQQLQAIRDAHAHTQAIRRFLFHPGFPVDIRHNSKIFRERLAEWAAKRLD